MRIIDWSSDVRSSDLLFSFRFGASMLLIIDRAEASGQNSGSVHYRRMAWLALLGLCHYFFIWWGDILFLYAAIGCIAFRFRAWEARRLIPWADRKSVV